MRTQTLCILRCVPVTKAYIVEFRGVESGGTIGLDLAMKCTVDQYVMIWTLGVYVSAAHAIQRYWSDLDKLVSGVAGDGAECAPDDAVKTSSSAMRTEEVFERVVRSRNPLFRVNRVSSGSAVDVRSTVEGHEAGRKGAEASGGCGMPWWC